MKRLSLILLLSALSAVILFAQPENNPKYFKKYQNCVIWGNKNKAKRLIEKGYSIDSKDAEGKTILMYCLKTNNTAFARYFIEAGANVNAADTFGNTCLHYALENTRDKQIVYTLVEKGAKIDAVNRQNYSPFHFSILFACEELPFYFIEKGVNYKLITALNENALHLSIEAGCDSLTNYLLKQNINLFLQDNNGLTPLLQACRFKKSATAIELIKQGADVNLPDNYGTTPLDFTIWNSDTLCFMALMAYGAKVDKPDYLRSAAELENETFIKELLLKEANDSLPSETHDDFYNLGLLNWVKSDLAENTDKKRLLLKNSINYYKKAKQLYKKRENELLAEYTGVILGQIIEAALTGEVSGDESEVEREYNYCFNQVKKCNARIKKAKEKIEKLETGASD